MPPKPQDLVAVSARLPRPLVARLQEIADQRGFTLTYVLRVCAHTGLEILEQRLVQQPQVPPS
jgi:predicted DNA-binding protein